jgi:hypothetical protein
VLDDKLRRIRSLSGADVPPIVVIVRHAEGDHIVTSGFSVYRTRYIKFTPAFAVEVPLFLLSLATLKRRRLFYLGVIITIASRLSA